jgi:hypothetical protein
LATSRVHNYRLNVKTRRQELDEKRNDPGKQARRWVVERTHSWLNRFRKLLVSFEKTEASYRALLSLAAALICWRQTTSITDKFLIDCVAAHNLEAIDTRPQKQACVLLRNGRRLNPGCIQRLSRLKDLAGRRRKHHSGLCTWRDSES